MNNTLKKNRYQRIYKQLEGLFIKEANPIARMATISALLHNKMENFFWTGFYILDNKELIVGPYQGTLACILLKKNTGVCWAGINSKKSVVVADVNKFPGHIACSSLSNSEIVIPVFKKSEIVAVLDIDSKIFNCFNETDAIELEKIVTLIYQ